MSSKGKRTTLTRIYKDDLYAIKSELNGIDSADAIRMAWRQYSAVQKAGRIMYGKLWKKPKR
jgi:hypothetical protein